MALISVFLASAFNLTRSALSDADGPSASPPKMARADVTDCVGAASSGVVMPISVEGGFVIVDADINGHGPLPMLFDTGAEDGVTLETAAALGLQSKGPYWVQDSGGKIFPATHAEVQSLRLATVELSGQQIGVFPLPQHLTDRGVRPSLAGLIGYELLSRFAVRLDYENKTLAIQDPKRISCETGGVKLPLLFSDKVPAVRAAADEIPGVFLVDTGSVGAITLRHSFVEEHRLEARHPSPLRIKTIGAAGSFETILTRLDSFDVAGSRIERPAVRLPLAADQGLPFADVDGSIGYEILRQFVITFDYPAHNIRFERSKAFGARTGGGSAGFQAVKETGEGFKVTTVLPNTAASDAGVQLGDLIVAIDGSSTAMISLSDLAVLLRRPPGSLLNFDIVREGNKRSLQLKLKDVFP